MSGSRQAAGADRSGSPEATIEAALGAGERVAWRGAPKRGIAFAPLDLVLIPFSLLWAMSAVGGGRAVLAGDPPLWVAAIVGAFGIAAVYLTAGRFALDRERRRRTAYALTERRALIASGLWRPRIREIPLRSGMRVAAQKGTSGVDVYLGRPSTAAAMRVAFLRPLGIEPSTAVFERLDDEAARAVVAAARSLGAAPPEEDAA